MTRLDWCHTHLADFHRTDLYIHDYMISTKSKMKQPNWRPSTKICTHYIIDTKVIIRILYGKYYILSGYGHLDTFIGFVRTNQLPVNNTILPAMQKLCQLDPLFQKLTPGRVIFCISENSIYAQHPAEAANKGTSKAYFIAYQIIERAKDSVIWNNAIWPTKIILDALFVGKRKIPWKANTIPGDGLALKITTRT